MPELPLVLQSSRRNLYLIVGIVLVVAIGTAVIIAHLQKTPQSATVPSPPGPETKLYAALANAAKQKKLRVAMYRETFANQADANARRNVGNIASSLSEIDTGRGKYRSVFAHNILAPDHSFSVGRCIDGKTYDDLYSPPARRTDAPKTLQDAATRLSLLPDGNLYYVDIPAVNISCPHIGLMPASPPIAVARLSDGLMPVTFSGAEAAQWQKKLASARLFAVRDEGMVDHAGQKLHKFSFTPKGDGLKVNEKLYTIFYETGEIKKIKAEHPRAEVAYEFQSINPLNSGGIKGFYLIDDHTNLPVYSELAGINPDKTFGETEGAARNIARTKQTYSYPTQLTIDLATPLAYLE